MAQHSNNNVEIADEILEGEDDFEIEQKNTYLSIQGFMAKIFDWAILIFGIYDVLSLNDPQYEISLIKSFIYVILAVGFKIWLLCSRKKLTKYLNSERITSFFLSLFERIAIFTTLRFITVLKPLILYEPQDRTVFWIIFFIMISLYIEFIPEFFTATKTKIKKNL
jgi:hypothetical protein